MKLLSGNSNKVLSKNIAKYLKTKLVNSSIRKFADGEVYVEINENIRGNSIFIVQSISCLLYTSPSPRDATLSRMPSSA